MERLLFDVCELESCRVQGLQRSSVRWGKLQVENTCFIF